MKKLLWFSRHLLTTAQVAELTEKLGNIEITQLSGSPANVHVPFDAQAIENGEGFTPHEIVEGSVEPLKNFVKNFDFVAAVLPTNMLEQILPFTPFGVITAQMARTVTNEGKTVMVHEFWQVVKEVKIVTDPL
jgi:hypothetical protein